MSSVKRWEAAGQWVEIDLDLCNAAANCVDICPGDVYHVVGGKVNAERIGDCVECGACLNECPNNAILTHWAWE
jgi:NAD-dependent dihydropyrimidine dehydrogenase PreA subunit